MPTKMSKKKKIGFLLMALPGLTIEYAMRILNLGDGNEQPSSGRPSDARPRHEDTSRPS